MNPPYAKPDLFNRTKDYIFSYRDPDTITNDTTLSTISSPDPSHPHSMQGLIREIRQSLVYIEKSIRYERVGGVDCYQIEPEDRYLIRSFMLSIHAIYPSGHKYTPKISISRTGEALLIRFVPAEKNRPSFLLQVTGLVGTVCLEGGKSNKYHKMSVSLWKISDGLERKEETIKINIQRITSKYDGESPVLFMPVHMMNSCSFSHTPVIKWQFVKDIRQVWKRKMVPKKAFFSWESPCLSKS